MKKTKATAAVFVVSGALLTNGGTDVVYGSSEETAKNADGNYNILFITTDQERYFDEYPEETEYKARELLAEMGTTFEKHYVCSNMSTSSRSVIYTGTHITDTLMLDNTDFAWQDALSEEITTIGDRMRETGLYTAYKGKWHMGDFSIFDEVENTLTDLEEYGFADWGVKNDYVGKVHEGYEIDPVIIADSVHWLKSKGVKLNEEGQSFFLAVNLINPHDIMNYSTEDGYEGAKLELAGEPNHKVYEKTYSEELPSSWNQDIDNEENVYAVKLFKKQWSSISGKISEDHFDDLQDYYFNCIQDCDNNLMTLLTELEHMDLLENTIIVFTSDHGEMQGAHGLKGKGGFIYDYNLHVPMIIYHPDYEGGQRIQTVTSHMDLAPTFIDMTYISDEEKKKISEGLSGKSLMDLMDGTKDSVREGALFCYEMLSVAASAAQEGSTNESPLESRSFVRAIVTEDYKFARYFSPLNFNVPESYEDLLANNDIELYDLKNDPDEMKNLAADPETNKELIMEMNTLLNETIAAEIGVDDGSEFQDVLKKFQELSANQ